MTSSSRRRSRRSRSRLRLITRLLSSILRVASRACSACNSNAAARSLAFALPSLACSAVAFAFAIACSVNPSRIDADQNTVAIEKNVRPAPIIEKYQAPLYMRLAVCKVTSKMDTSVLPLVVLAVLLLLAVGGAAFLAVAEYRHRRDRQKQTGFDRISKPRH